MPVAATAQAIGAPAASGSPSAASKGGPSATAVTGPALAGGTHSSKHSRASSKKYGTVVGLGALEAPSHGHGVGSGTGAGPAGSAKRPTVMGFFEKSAGAGAGVAEGKENVAVLRDIHHPAGGGGLVGEREAAAVQWNGNGNGNSNGNGNGNGNGSVRSTSKADDDGPWSVSVAEAKEKEKAGRKRNKHTTYTLYVTTPTHNLTLLRTVPEITELDQKIRDSQSASNTLPTLPPLPQTSQTSRRILKTISRTLSPNSRNRVALPNLSTALSSVVPDVLPRPSSPPILPPPSFGTPIADSMMAVRRTPSFLKTDSDKEKEKDRSSATTPTATTSTPTLTEDAGATGVFRALSPFSSPSSPPPPVSVNGASGPTTANGTASTTHDLATYFTTIGNLPFIRRHKAWKRFVRVGAEDLQSVRVERRVRRVRSDLAVHVPALVAPTNVNVGETPGGSRSDVGEMEDLVDPSPVPSNDDKSVPVDRTGADPASSASKDSEAAVVAPAAAAVAASSTMADTDVEDLRDEDAGGDADDDDGSVDDRQSAIASLYSSKRTRKMLGIEDDDDDDGGDAPSAHQDKETGRSPPNAGSTVSPSSAATPTKRAKPSTTTSSPTAPGSSSKAGTAGRQETEGEDDEAGSTPGAKPKAKKIKKSSNGEQRRSARREKVTVDDFDMIRVLGKGCAGKVLLVRHLPSQGLYAMKSIHKRHVLAHQELQHTLTEQAVLKRMAREVQDPFVVRLWWSFHDKNNLYLVMDFHNGGDLATQLSRWGRLGRDRARFYAAEIVEGVEGLHKAGVIYRDLKPENVLIGSDGHIVLSDFGLSKEFPSPSASSSSGTGRMTPQPTSPRSHSSRDLTHRPPWMGASDDGAAPAPAPADGGVVASNLWGPGGRFGDERDVTTTFCGTAEYLAPEVIQGSAYSYEVDWWSFGTMLYEMLTGITPFWADTHADMYVRVLHDDLIFPEDRVLDTDTKSILRGLLQRNPMLRMKEPRIKKHPYFSMIDWQHVFHKRYIPPYVPPTNPLDELDTQNFDEAFLDMQPTVQTANGEEGADGDVSEEGSKAKGAGSSQAAARQSHERDPDAKSLFDGYSYRGRPDDSSSIISSIEAQENEEEEDSEAEEASAKAAVDALGPVGPPDSSHQRDGQLAESASARPRTSASTRPKSGGSFHVDDAAGVEAAGGSEESQQPQKQQQLQQQQQQQQQQEAKRKSVLASGLALSEAIAETEDDFDDDEDWERIDDTSVLQSDVNGRGQNLIARGVVDTYRLLVRRGDSTRPSGSGAGTPAPGQTAAGGGSTTSSSTTAVAAEADRRRTTGLTRRLTKRPTSRLPLSRSSNNNLTSASVSVASLHNNDDDEGGGGGTTAGSGSQVANGGGKKTASPSLASSEDFTGNERHKRLRRNMKRFTGFFEHPR